MYDWKDKQQPTENSALAELITSVVLFVVLIVAVFLSLNG